ncbi:MAG: hypothetical protein P1R58_09995 [bacterium]|nr:hypothetical protein [bacterium]
MKLKQLGVMSCGITSGAIYAVVGLIFGGIISLIAALGFAVGGSSNEGEMFGLIFGVGAVIFAPIVYGVMGFIGGLIMGAVYNLVASFTGGIEMIFEEDKPASAAPPPSGY